MARGKYKIGLISYLLGLTPEALRYYENQGIISPEKSTGSSYRMFSAWDLHILIRIRSYRRYGFSLEEAVETLDSLDTQEVLSLYDTKSIALAEEIHRKEHLLHQLKTERSLVIEALANIGKFHLTLNPDMHFIETQSSYDIIQGRTDLYKHWIDKTPYIFSGGIFLLDEEKTLRYGLMAEDNLLEDVDESFYEGTYSIPSQPCVSTFFTSGSKYELKSDMFDPMLAFMEEKGLEIVGSPFAHTLLMARDEAGDFHSLYQGWIPYRGECELYHPPFDGTPTQQYFYRP